MSKPLKWSRKRPSKPRKVYINTKNEDDLMKKIISKMRFGPIPVPEDGGESEVLS